MDGACDFSLGGFGGDDAEFFREQTVVARKPHECYECLAEIKPGERHKYVSGKWGGEWSSYRFCLACDDISNEVFDDGRLYGSLWEGMAENWKSGAPLQPCLNRMSTVAAKTKMVEQWKIVKEIQAPKAASK